MPGLFISFEGLDGCGKSTQMSRAAEYLRQLGFDPVLTREPGGCKISEQIREILLDDENEEMDPWTEALLYAAARRQHVEEVIRPALTAGKIVLCDRFLDSSIAYQGYGRELGEEAVRQINARGTNDCQPDLTLFFDCPADVAEERRADQNETPDRLEHSGSAFFERVHGGFTRLAAQEPERIVTINATGTSDETQTLVRDVIGRVLREKGFEDA